ncbi:hypothetical protein SDC9_162457 [bioreactor metagenome]|uniref:Uncharacterized protein n=1 Tax=bioreactor metagenome TaxID=1076179 RepID=A0A645FL36_9ZZZZ
MLVRIGHGQGAGDKLVVQRLKARLRVVWHFADRAGVALHGAGGKYGAKRHGTGVDLVKGQPILYFAGIAGKNGLAVVEVKAHQFAAGPAIVLFDQGIRHFVMADGDQRLDAVLFAAVKHAVVKGKAGFVWGVLGTGGENAGPVDRGAKHLKPHLGKQGNVLFVVVVKIDRFPAGVTGAGPQLFSDPFRRGVAAAGAMVRHAVALAVHIPRALKLVCGAGAAP